MYSVWRSLCGGEISFFILQQRQHKQPKTKTMINQDHVALIRQEVKKYLMDNSSYIPTDIMSDPDQLSHVINIGTSIMCTKWEVGYKSPGSFVESFIDNDLMRAISNADSTNVRCLKFYALMIYNMSYVGEPIKA